MTETCLNATATPRQGEVALGYWDTLQRALGEAGQTRSQIVGNTDLKQNSTKVSVQEYLAAFERGLENDAEFALKVGQAASLKTFPVLGMTLLSCSNLEQALRQILRYESLNHDLGRSELDISSRVCTYHWMANPSYVFDRHGRLAFQLALSVFAGIKSFAPLLLQRTLPIKRLTFIVHESRLAPSIERFFACPVSFGAKSNSIEVDAKVLDWKLAFADPSMFSALTKHAESLLSVKKQNQDLVRRIQEILPDALRRQTFKIEDLAAELSLSSRSVQRKLKEQGLSYQGILDETCLKLARYYLKETSLSLIQIAHIIGFKEQSSFNHAFKNWTGKSPGEFR